MPDLARVIEVSLLDLRQPGAPPLNLGAVF
jgi:hypothetical protein